MQLLSCMLSGQLLSCIIGQHPLIICMTRTRLASHGRTFQPNYCGELVCLSRSRSVVRSLPTTKSLHVQAGAADYMMYVSCWCMLCLSAEFLRVVVNVSLTDSQILPGSPPCLQGQTQSLMDTYGFVNITSLNSALNQAPTTSLYLCRIILR